jgi:hypothetical protein
MLAYLNNLLHEDDNRDRLSSMIPAVTFITNFIYGSL